MAYTKEELNNLGITDSSDARQKIVDLSLFDNIESISLSDKTKRDIDYTKDIYVEYLQKLSEFKESVIERILKALMSTETIDNHFLERENINLLMDYSETHYSTAIRYLVKKLITENQPLNNQIIKKAHEILMRGTSNASEINSGYRSSNNHYVGYVENGERIINYLPISHQDIKEAMQIFFSYYDANVTSELEVFTKPFIIHGLLAALQVFADGNTRMARTLQYVKLQTLTNEIIVPESNLKPFELPAIYFSKNYLPYRYEYRKLIEEIAQNPHSEKWNRWIEFNLHRMQERIYAMDNSMMILCRKTTKR